MKHSNICYISRMKSETRKPEFIEVDGVTVKNSYGFDLFRYKPTETSDYYVVTEAQTGCKICEIRKNSNGDGIISTPKEIDKYLEIMHVRENKPKHEVLKPMIEQMIKNCGLSPRYTEPDKRREPKPKKQKEEIGLQRIKFFVSIGYGGVEERTGYLYESNGLQFALEKVEYGYRVTELSSGLYAGQIQKEIPEDWRGFAEAKEHITKKQNENPQYFIDFKNSCEAYKERIKKYMGNNDEKPIYSSVKEMKDDISNRKAPMYYIVERPNGEQTVRRFSSFSGNRFNGLNTKGEEVLGIELKGVKFLSNGFIVQGFVIDFRVTDEQIAEFEGAIITNKEAKKEADAERARQEEDELKKNRRSSI